MATEKGRFNFIFNYMEIEKNHSNVLRVNFLPKDICTTKSRFRSGPLTINIFSWLGFDSQNDSSNAVSQYT